MKYALAIPLLLGLAVLASACDFDARISEKEAARYAERNRELFESLPIPPGAKLEGAEDLDCAGGFKREKTLSCALLLTFETTEPLISVMIFYDDYFAAHRWRFANIDSETSEAYENGEFHIGLGLSPPLRACPDGAFDPEGEKRCVAREIRRNDRKPHTYSLLINPD
jgi:hypothetical protein